MNSTRTGLVAAALLVALSAGCAPEGGEVVTALFELPRDSAPPPSGFYALPFPNDLRVDEVTGAIDFSDYIRPNPLLETYVGTIAEHQRGFSVTAAVHLRFSAALDPGSLPATAEDSLLDDAAVYLVDIDPDSPRYGERVPVIARFQPSSGTTIGDNWLGVLPYPGFVLADETTYAVIATDRLRAEGGGVVVRDDDLEAVFTGQGDDSAAARARAIYAPLFDFLDQSGGDERDDVISAAVFTTQAATSLAGKMRESIHGQLAVPAPRDIQLADDPDPPPTGFHWFDGLYDGPNFQRGDPPHRDVEDGGDIVLDADTGAAVIQRMEELRLSFAVPLGPMPASGWPVVLYAHGTGGDFHTFEADGTAARLTAQGLAVVSIDQVMHPPRIPEGNSPELLFFNFLNPLAARDNTLQGAADLFQLVRLVRNVDLVAPGDIPVRFDPDRVYFFGHSQGGLTGPPFLIHEPLVDGAVLSGSGGLLYLSMLLKTEPLDIAGLVSTLLSEPTLDEFNPILALLQTFMDRADPVVYGPYLVRETMPGVAPKHIYQSEGFTDRFTPTRSIEALATSIGGDLVAPVVQDVPGLDLRGRSTVQAPVSGNLEGVTVVFTQYREVADSDGHFVVFEVPEAEKQSAEFLGTLARDGAATLVTP